MVNKIIELIHEELVTKCWVQYYGGLTFAGKQTIEGRSKQFPITAWAFDTNGEPCEPQTKDPYLMIPDDRKNSVIFWQQQGKVRTSKIPGLSSNRRMKKGEVLVEMVAWLNLNKFVSPVDAKVYIADQIVLEAVKTLECTNITNLSIQDNGIGNIVLEVIEIGDVNSYRQAMAKYSIDKIEAVTVWPFSAFTMTCKLSFIFAPYMCDIEAVECVDNTCNPTAPLVEQVNP